MFWTKKDLISKVISGRKQKSVGEQLKLIGEHSNLNIQEALIVKNIYAKNDVNLALNNVSTTIGSLALIVAILTIVITSPEVLFGADSDGAGVFLTVFLVVAVGIVFLTGMIIGLKHYFSDLKIEAALSVASHRRACREVGSSRPAPIHKPCILCAVGGAFIATLIQRSRKR